MQYLVRSDFTAERQCVINPEIAGWPHLTFRVYGFTAEKPLDGESVDDELLMIFLNGMARVTVDGVSWQIERGTTSIDGPVQCIYMPPQHRYYLEPATDCTIAYARYPAQGRFAPRFISSTEASTVVAADGSIIRYFVRPGEAEHLIAAELLSPASQWALGSPLSVSSGWTLLPERLCYYRLYPQDGWALQRLYDESGQVDEALVVRHGDGVLLRDHQHAVVAAPGYGLYGLSIGAVTAAE